MLQPLTLASIDFYPAAIGSPYTIEVRQGLEPEHWLRLTPGVTTVQNVTLLR
ncbi:MAG: hypothetical protein IPL74_00880 [Bacteroidetes bacterium]|nr:hypothetical protein [Bacteroidota bacterium]